MDKRYYKRKLRELCIKLFKLDEWHYYDYYDKDYAKYTVKMIEMIINNQSGIEGDIIEIGCGLGDVIGKIDSGRIKKIGYDADKDVVKVAKLLNLGTEFVTGSFEAVRNKKISFLIMMNFLHFINPLYLERNMAEIINNNRIRYIVFDELSDIENTSYKYRNNPNSFLENGFKKAFESRRFPAAEGAGRHVFIYEKVDYEQ